MVVGAIALIPEVPIGRLCEIAKYAEDLGFARCWVNDEGLAAHDVYVTLAAIALNTSKIQIGPGITNPYTRHASSTAGAIAALDHLSDGRGFLGIGAGGSLTLDPVGIKRQRPVVAVRETVEACRALFAGESTDMSGELVKLSQARMSFSRPDIEIWLAGRGPRMLALGASTCDGVMLEFIYKPHLSAVIEKIRDTARTTGNAPRISYSTMIVTNERTRTVAKQHLTYRLVDSPDEVKQAIGLSKDDSQRIREALPQGLEVAGELIRDEWIDPFVISGSTSECASELAQIVEANSIDEFGLPLLDAQDAERTLDTVGALLS